MAKLTIGHNFEPDRFMWLWAKYVYGFNPAQHCTNSIRGKYSKKFSKPNNPHLKDEKRIVLDEFPDFKAVYICGVAKKGYSQKKNYPHNVHIPIEFKEGQNEKYVFETWEVTIENGLLLPIPSEMDLPPQFRALPPEFTTCRIFRWAVKHFS